MPEFVSVQVPVERVQEVYELLGRQPARPSVIHQIAEDGYPAGWSQALIDRMFIESSDAMRRILLAIARQSPGFVPTSHIAAASGLTVRQVVASLGPFEKRVRGRYGMALWPFEAREFVDAGIFKYSMSPATATRIIDLMAQVGQAEKATSYHA
jgi:hypothetical protein